MNPQVLTQTIKNQLQVKGFQSTPENEAFIETLVESIITHIQSQAIVQVTTTGSASAQSGIGKIS